MKKCKVKVINRYELIREIRNNSSNLTIDYVFQLVTSLEIDEVELDEHMIHLLKISQNCELIVIDDKKSTFSRYEIETRSELIEDKIVNPLGLTEAEHWFNDLSESDKKKVIELSRILNPNVVAGG